MDIHTPALERLKTYRLEHDLSFDDLSARMTAEGFPVMGRVLHRLLNGGQTAARDRTAWKVHQFVARLDDDGRNGHRPPQPTTPPTTPTRRRRKAARRAR